MKPIVHYKHNIQNYIHLNKPAFIQPLNHPSDQVSNKTWAKTSTVIRLENNGEFETKNTIYQLEIS